MCTYLQTFTGIDISRHVHTDTHTYTHTYKIHLACCSVPSRAAASRLDSLSATSSPSITSRLVGWAAQLLSYRFAIGHTLIAPVSTLACDGGSRNGSHTCSRRSRDLRHCPVNASICWSRNVIMHQFLKRSAWRVEIRKVSVFAMTSLCCCDPTASRLPWQDCRTRQSNTRHKCEASPQIRSPSTDCKS